MKRCIAICLCEIIFIIYVCMVQTAKEEQRQNGTKNIVSPRAPNFSLDKKKFREILSVTIKSESESQIAV